MQKQIYNEIKHWISTLTTDVDVEALVTVRELNNLSEKLYLMFLNQSQKSINAQVTT